METTYDIAVIGDSNVGKTNFIQSFIDDGIKLDKKVYSKTINVHSLNNCKIKLNIWDINEPKVSDLCMEMDGIIILYSVENPDSFEKTKEWLREIKLNSTNIVEIMIIGLKQDLKQIIPNSDGEKLAKSYGTLFEKASCVPQFNIYTAFDRLTKKIHNAYNANKKKNFCYLL